MNTNFKVEIVSGNFSKNGNYSAYDEDNERYYIHKRLMESLGWSKDADVKLPFWTKAGTREFNTLDENGEVQLDVNGNAVKFQRLQILSVYKSREAMIESAINKASVDIEIHAGIQAKASVAGLSQKSIDALASLVF